MLSGRGDAWASAGSSKPPPWDRRTVAIGFPTRCFSVVLDAKIIKRSEAGTGKDDSKRQGSNRFSGLRLIPRNEMGSGRCLAFMTEPARVGRKRRNPKLLNRLARQTCEIRGPVCFLAHRRACVGRFSRHASVIPIMIWWSPVCTPPWNCRETPDRASQRLPT